MGYNGNSIAAARISQAMSGIQSRFEAISSKTGISFNTYLQAASQTTTPSAETAAAEPAVSESLGEMVDLLAPYYEDENYYNDIYKNDNGGISKAGPVSGGTLASSEKLPAGKYDSLITEVANKYGVDPLLVKAVCYAESSYNPNSTSRSGAMGLMQLMPATARGLGVENAYDPEENMDGGVRYILAQLERFGGDARKAVAAYNCGPGRVAKLDDLTDPSQRSQLPTETQNYLTRIENLLLSVDASYILDGRDKNE